MPSLKNIALVALAVAALAAAPAGAETLYEATLLPEHVVPPSGASAYGTCSFLVDDAHSEVRWNLIFAGLDSPQTGAAFMHAAVDAPGVVMHELPLGTPLTGVWTLDDEARAALAAGELAVQISSEWWPDGAIRGNFEETMTPVEASTWGQVKSLYR